MLDHFNNAYRDDEKVIMYLFIMNFA